LETAVTSALAQRGDEVELEVIVVNDRSTDAPTVEALDRVRELDHVVVLSNSGPPGSAAARNTGIRHATSEWIAFLDADDWWPEESLTRRFHALQVFPKAEWIGGDFLELNRDGTWETVGRFERNLATYDFLRPAYAESRCPILLSNPLAKFLKQAPTHTIVSLVRRSLIERSGGFDESLLRQQDYHLFLRLSAIADFVYVPSIVACYRHHESNSTRSLTHTQEWRIKAIEDLLSRPEFWDVRPALMTQIFDLHASNSYSFREEGKFMAAVGSALRAIATSPSNQTAWRSLAAALLRR
jgi:glycosyltransferase involved in cell wall biosynthesis